MNNQEAPFISTGATGNLSKWTTVGTNITFSTNLTGLNINAPLPNFNNSSYVVLSNYYFNAKRIKVQFLYKKVDSNNSELLLGFLSVTTVFNVKLKIKNIGDATFFYLVKDGSGVGSPSTTLLLSTIIAVNSTANILFEFDKDSFRLTVIRGSYTISSPLVQCYQNCSQLFFSPTLGNHYISELNIYSDYSNQVSIGFHGDSLSANYPSYADYCGRMFPSYAIFAGQSDRLVELMKTIPISNVYNERIAVFLIGVNDITYGYDATTFGVKILETYNSSASKRPTFICTLLPTTVYDVTKHNIAIHQNIPVNNIIEAYNLMKNPIGSGLNPAYDIGDGLHLNDTGARVLGQFIYKWLKAKGY